MRVLVCGSRHFNDYERLKEVLDAYPIDALVEGEARGADLLGRRYGEEHGIRVYAFPADWNQYGKRAGPIRNAQMVREGRPDMVIAFLAHDSKGTKNMIDQATKAGIETRIIEI